MGEQLTIVNRNVSIKAIRSKTKCILSSLLNPIKILQTDKGLQRDWHGLVDLCSIEGQLIPYIESSNDPTSKILCLWCENNQESSTIENLLTYLEEMDRYDVIYDTKHLLDEDIKFYKQNPNEGCLKTPNLELDKCILTTDDVSRLNQGLELQNYDAFVLFDDDDIDFATQLIEIMEREYNMKLCVKDRDLVGGGIEHDSIIKLISDRCNRLVVIVSNAFLNSPVNKFFYSFAQAIGIEQRQRKIIPCIYKAVDKMPPELSCYFMLDYRRSSKLFNFWQKLSDSIVAPQPIVLNKSVSNIETGCSTDSNNTLRPHNRVKFSSMVNLNTPDTELLQSLDKNMTSSTSANSLGVSVYSESVKKLKPKTSWLKKILHQKNTVESTNSGGEHSPVEIEKKKQRFWNRHSSKRKLAIAS